MCDKKATKKDAPVNVLVSCDARHIKMFRDRLGAWKDEAKTNKCGMAEFSEKHIAILEKELARIDS